MPQLGNFLFLLGFALLILCGFSLPFWKNFNSGLMVAVLTALIAAAVLIMVGEMLRYSGRRQKKYLDDGFMNFYRQVRGKARRESPPKRARRAASRQCVFCGVSLAPGTIPAKLNGVLDVSHSESQAGHCEECGKVSCPQCAFRKGMEMGLRSFRCPSCGGRVR
jgi:hypothetical protein